MALTNSILGASLGATSSHHASVHKMPSSATLGMDDDNMTFDSPADEARHYRERYRRIMDMLDETRAELDEFQASSKELEDELERELAATEKQQTELKERIKRLEAEKDEWKNKHIALQKMHSSTTSNMQREMDNLRSERDKTLVALRDLELGNDELERNERVAVSSLLDLESKYNRAIEEKTLLEQEIISNQELEEECQRLKDDVRDANNEIAILKEQLARAVPTPPSSISVPISPRQIPIQGLPPVEIASTDGRNGDGYDDDETLQPFQRNIPSPALPKSATMSSIPSLASPAPKRHSTFLPHSPFPALSRSTNTRNLAAVAGPQSPSPGLRRSPSSRLPAPSPARVVSATTAKSKGFKLLHELQARLKATDDKLGTKVPKRNVSNPIPLVSGLNKRNSSISTTSQATVVPKASHSRISELAQDTTPAALPSEKSSMLSPNGWVLVEDDMTPLHQISGWIPDEPQSPLVPVQRAVSQATNKSTVGGGGRALPSRPGIPSPLASMHQLSKSTSVASKLSQARGTGTSSTGDGRPPSRNLLSQSVRPGSRQAQTQDQAQSRSHSRQGNLHQSTSNHTRPPSRSDHVASSSRPLSPSLLPRPATSLMQHMSPQAQGPSSSRPPSRTTSRSSHVALGRGPPPASHSHNTRTPSLHASSSVVPTLTSALPATPSIATRRTSRRSSVGAADSSLVRPTGIPQPRTPSSRPASVPVFQGTPPPPVPRIPSVHLRESKRAHHGHDHRRQESLVDR